MKPWLPWLLETQLLLLELTRCPHPPPAFIARALVLSYGYSGAVSESSRIQRGAGASPIIVINRIEGDTNDEFQHYGGRSKQTPATSKHCFLDTRPLQELEQLDISPASNNWLFNGGWKEAEQQLVVVGALAPIGHGAYSSVQKFYLPTQQQQFLLSSGEEIEKLCQGPASFLPVHQRHRKGYRGGGAP